MVGQATEGDGSTAYVSEFFDLIKARERRLHGRSLVTGLGYVQDQGTRSYVQWYYHMAENSPRVCS